MSIEVIIFIYEHVEYVEYVEYVKYVEYVPNFQYIQYVQYVQLVQYVQYPKCPINLVIFNCPRYIMCKIRQIFQRCPICTMCLICPICLIFPISSIFPRCQMRQGKVQPFIACSESAFSASSKILNFLQAKIGLTILFLQNLMVGLHKVQFS